MGGIHRTLRADWPDSVLRQLNCRIVISVNTVAALVGPDSVAKNGTENGAEMGYSHTLAREILSISPPRRQA